jgi:hypothetical protein
VLTRNHRQEALSRAYVQAIAACCGMGSSKPDPDYGIDLTLHDITPVGRRRTESGYKLDIQAKSTTLASVQETHIRYDLDVNNYDDLRLSTGGCPRILVVLLLPKDESHWFTQTEDELVLRHCSYWVSLRGQEPSRNRKTVRIQVPRVNVFSADALRGIMNRLKEGGVP